MAALLVIGVHTAFFSGVTGNPAVGIYTARLEIGVSVFFVISGFLLYRPFVAAHFGIGPAVPIRGFWLRRLKRIVPAYWVAFLVITYVMRTDTVRHGWGSLAIYLGFAQIYVPSHAITGILQAWSLCTEMSFYLALPLWALAMGRLGKRLAARRGAVAGVQLASELSGLTFLVVASFAFRIIAFASPSQLARATPTWLPANADLFALGMLLAVISVWLTQQDRRPIFLWHPALPWFTWAAAATVYLAVSHIGLPRSPLVTFPIGAALARQTLYGLFAFLVVAPAVVGPQDYGLIRRGLQLRPVALIGIVSYGVYLWHESWIDMMLRWTGHSMFTIGFAALTIPVVILAIAAATASYTFVERPVRQFRRGPVPIKPALTGLAVEP